MVVRGGYASPTTTSTSPSSTTRWKTAPALPTSASAVGPATGRHTLAGSQSLPSATQQLCNISALNPALQGTPTQRLQSRMSASSLRRTAQPQISLHRPLLAGNPAVSSARPRPLRSAMPALPAVTMPAWWTRISSTTRPTRHGLTLAPYFAQTDSVAELQRSQRPGSPPHAQQHQLQLRLHLRQIEWTRSPTATTRTAPPTRPIPRNNASEYGPSDYDLKHPLRSHRRSVRHTQLPYPQRIADALVNGFQVNATYTWSHRIPVDASYHNVSTMLRPSRTAPLSRTS